MAKPLSLITGDLVEAFAQFNNICDLCIEISSQRVLML